MKKILLMAGVATIAIMPTMGFASDALEKALIDDSKFYVDMRYRYEHVEQDGFDNDADASTIRTKVGYKTGTFHDFQGGFEVEFSGELKNGGYNDTVNGKNLHPTIADPEHQEINQAWVAWTGLPDTTIKYGRQAVNIDNQRFVGTVGWRQNDQTFDSLVGINSSIDNLTLLYGFVGNVNRINGNDHFLGDLDTDTHLANASYQLTDWLKVTAYGYWLDIDESAANSSKTYGLRLTGDTMLNDEVKFFYELEGANQDDHGNNPANYDADYWHVSPGITWNQLTLQAGYEVMEGNGTSSFRTPLATGHKFNGWADKFLTTPANGLEDAYGKVAYKFASENEWFNGTKFVAVYHDYEAENGSADYGDEWNLLLKSRKFAGADFMDGWSVAFKYADYDADTFDTDTEKFWLTWEMKF
jgi:hypothetical protein